MMSSCHNADLPVIDCFVASVGQLAWRVGELEVDVKDVPVAFAATSNSSVFEHVFECAHLVSGLQESALCLRSNISESLMSYKGCIFRL